MSLVGKNGKYDCSIVDASGNEVGLMLTRMKNGALNYMETSDTAVSAQYSTVPGYSSFEPEKKMRLGQSDWRG